MSGFTRFEGPVLIEIPFSMSPEKFDECDNREWPEPDGVRTVRASDLPPAEPDDPAPAPAPTPTPDQPQSEKRRRPPKPVDPEEERRAAAQPVGVRHRLRMEVTR